MDVHGVEAKRFTDLMDRLSNRDILIEIATRMFLLEIQLKNIESTLEKR